MGVTLEEDELEDLHPDSIDRIELGQWPHPSNTLDDEDDEGCTQVDQGYQEEFTQDSKPTYKETRGRRKSSFAH